MTLILSATHSAGQDLPGACVGTKVKYGVKGLNGVSTFQWTISGPGTFTVPAASIQSFANGDSVEVTWDNAFPGGAYTFEVTESTPWGCVGIPYDQSIIINSPDIFIPVGALPEFLKLCQNGSVTVDPGSNYTNFLWQDNSTNQTFVTNQSGTLQVRLVSSDFSCSYDTTEVRLYSLPYIYLGADTTLCAGQALMLDASNPTFTSYLWSSGDIAPNFPVGSGPTQDIWVKVTDENGCVNSDTIRINQCDPGKMRIPYVFTPNGDGVNDKWEIPEYLYFTEVNIRIFNRWGKEVFAHSGTYDAAAAWNGRDRNGNDLPMDSYHYIITVTLEGKTSSYRGSVTIIR
ncbi:gliding motility-associated C-terminal domain-containing protein [Williamwhitmania taraxaci]|uniref:gliding motility-associated C-terminal domain-containing protein n=1 Tax=Williamwhitmania taraxaci TaxID=1640674 RepID=UPI000B821733|nr:gliding motility-associated C-terminal domain-containing protein [Williamwhitmania taraxaci]